MLALVAVAFAVHADVVTATVHRRSTKGNVIVYTGTAHSRVFGTGTVSERAVVRGLGADGTFRIRYRRGTIRGTSSARGSAHANLTVSFRGTFRITGGTGPYRKARGSGTYTGSGPLDLSRASFRQTGRVSY